MATTRSTSIKSWQVYFVFFVSGGSALVYQVLWARWLGLAFGNTTASVSIVLAAFMCGLSLGSHYAGKHLTTIARPLRGYALTELGIGAFAIVFPFTSRGVEWLFTALISPDSAMPFALFVRAVLAFALLLVPTALMGATLPLLTDFFRRNPRASRGWKVGVLYTANTLGAAAGVLVTSLALIEIVGVLTTTVIAALLNFAVAALAWRLDAVDGDALVRTDGNASAPVVSSEGALAIAILAATGGLALSGEVLWTRTMETLLGTSTYAFSCIVFVFLVGIAFGSWAMSLAVARIRDRSTALVSLLLFMALWMVAGISLFRWLATHLGVAGGAGLSVGTILFIYFKVALLLVPLAVASGACFPLVTRILTHEGREAGGALVARAYAWNTVGSVLGSLLGGFLVAPWLDYVPALFVVAMGYALCGVSAAVYLSVRTSDRRVPLSIASVAVLAVVAALFAREEAYAVRYKGSLKVVFHEPGIQAVTTVLQPVDAPLATGLLVNGMGMTAKVTDTKMMAHLPMLLHPAPRDTLVICHGMGTTYRSALTHGGNVTVVELVGGVLDAFPYFYADAAEVLANPRGRRIVNDGRNFLFTTRERFDVITLDPPPPIDGAGVNNLYSLDFIELARDRLKDGGVMAHWLPFIGTASGVDDERTFQMLVATFRSAFPYVYGIVGYNDIGLHVIGAMRPLDVSADTIAQRLGNPAVVRDLNEFDRIPLTFFSGLRAIPPAAPDVLLITDDRPYLEFYFIRSAFSGVKKTFAHHLW